VEPPDAALRFVSEFNEELSIRESRKLADHFIAQQDTSTIEVSRMVKIGKAFRMIAEAAFELDPEAIIMGTHGASGFSEEFIGSNTRRVLKLAACPVIAVPSSFETSENTSILVPLDFQHPTKENFQFALNACKQLNAHMHILTVAAPGASEQAWNKMKQKLQELVQNAQHQGVTAEGDIVTSSERVADVILAHGKEKEVGMICMMTLREHSLREVVMGSTAAKIIHRSSLPVIAVRPKKRFVRKREGSIFG